MEIVNIEVEAFKFSELRLKAHTESMKEMRRKFGENTLEELADNGILRVEHHCKRVLNTDIEVCIDVRTGGSFDVDVLVTKVGSTKLPHSSQLNSCPHIKEAAKIVEDIQLYSKVLRNLERKGEHKPAQGEMLDLIDTRTRELTYEIVESVTAMFGEEIDQIHSEEWAETMAVQGGLLFTKEGKVIKGAVNYNQSTTGE